MPHALLQAAVAVDSLTALESSAQIAGIVESAVTALGIVVAGVWAYLIFVRQRQRYPRASLRQSLLCRTLPDGARMLTVEVTMANIGQRLIELDSASVVLQQLSPLSKGATRQALLGHDPLDGGGRREVLWYRVGYRRLGFTPVIEIEPGETETLLFEFRVSAKLEALKIQTNIENAVKRSRRNDAPQSKPAALAKAPRWMGWQCTTHHNLGTTKHITLLHAVGDEDDSHGP